PPPAQPSCPTRRSSDLALPEALAAGRVRPEPRRVAQGVRSVPAAVERHGPSRPRPRANHASRSLIAGHRWSEAGFASETALEERSEEHTSELQSPCNLV